MTIRLPEDLVDALLGPARETQLQFYTRRAMEESRSAQTAPCPQAAAAHRYLAAAYAALIAEETRTQDALEDLIQQIS